MNEVTRRFRDVTGTGAELGRLFAGLAAGQRVEVTEGQYLSLIHISEPTRPY